MIGSYRPEQIQSYNPLGEIPLSLISAEGLVFVRSNPNMSPELLEKLKKTEKKLWEKRTTLKYLLSEHEAEREYENRFVENGEAGKALISSIIADNPEQSLAEVIARYSIDTNTLFIHSAIWILDYYTSQKCLYLYAKKRDGSYRVTRWEPKLHAITPPINFQKMNNAKRSLNGDANSEKGNLIAVLETTNGNISAAAELLGISRPGYIYRLKKYGYMKENGTLDYKKLDDDASELREQGEENISMSVPSKTSLSDIKSLQSEKANKLSRAQIRTEFINSGYNIKKAANSLGIGKISLIELLKKYYPDALTISGCPFGIASEVYEMHEQDEKKTCDALNITPDVLKNILSRKKPD